VVAFKKCVGHDGGVSAQFHLLSDQFDIAAFVARIEDLLSKRGDGKKGDDLIGALAFLYRNVNLIREAVKADKTERCLIRGSPISLPLALKLWRNIHYFFL